LRLFLRRWPCRNPQLGHVRSENPVKYNYNAASITTIANNADWRWFSERAACKE